MRELASTTENLVGEYLAGLMEQRGLTVYGLARLADVPDSSLYRCLEGKQNLGYESLRRIAPHLGVRLGDLLIKAGTTPEELGTVGTPPKVRRFAAVLREIQDAIDDPRTSDAEAQRLLRTVRGIFTMWAEMRHPTPLVKEPAMRSRRRKQDGA